MTKPSNISAIETATDRPWDVWIQLLDDAGGRDRDHKGVVEIARSAMADTVESAGWWAQSIAVAYEQAIGRRRPGQRVDGSFETAVTVTMAGTKEAVMENWLKYIGDTSSINGRTVHNIRSSKTPIRLYWRCDLEDDTGVVVSTEQKTPSGTLFAVTHVRIVDEATKDDWSVYWKAQLGKFRTP